MGKRHFLRLRRLLIAVFTLFLAEKEPKIPCYALQKATFPEGKRLSFAMQTVTFYKNYVKKQSLINAQNSE